MLMEMGYSVLETESADDAQGILQHTENIQLLLTDIVMPGQLNGRDLADWAQREARAVTVALMSGYAPSETGLSDTPMLPKPFSQKQLSDFLDKHCP
jgi:CheY-like chemotaxis protein